MNTETESQKIATADAPQPKAKRTSARKAKPSAERNNKKAEVISMMKRAKGATLAEIMAATEWQAHTERGFVSIRGSKGGEKIDSSKNAANGRTGSRNSVSNPSSKRRFRYAGAAFLLMLQE